MIAASVFDDGDHSRSPPSAKPAYVFRSLRSTDRLDLGDHIAAIWPVCNGDLDRRAGHRFRGSELYLVRILRRQSELRCNFELSRMLANWLADSNNNKQPSARQFALTLAIMSAVGDFSFRYTRDGQ